MTKQESAAVYAAFAELESAAEQFHVAAQAMAQHCPKRQQNRLYTLCEDINVEVVAVDLQLDEVV
jgi:hypothetical protein